MATTSRPSPDLLGLRAVVRDPAARTVLLMMVGADLVLIALHLSAASRGLEASLHYIDLEYGHAESLQGLRWLWCLGLLGLVVVAARRWAFASLLPLLALLLVTDALELHERGGRAAASVLELPGVLGMRPQDLGELLVVALAGALVVAAAVAGIRVARPSERRHLVRILALVGLIALFGVAVDAVHALAVAEVASGDALGVVEDGGEMLGASALVAYLFLLAVRGPERIGRDRARAARVAAREAVPAG